MSKTKNIYIPMLEGELTRETCEFYGLDEELTQKLLKASEENAARKQQEEEDEEWLDDPSEGNKTTTK